MKGKGKYIGLVPILFLVLYALAVLRPYTPYVNYYLNKDKIASEQCVNKDQPEMECEGQCYLKSQVIKASEEESKKDKSGLIKIEFDKYPAPFCFDLSSDAETLYVSQLKAQIGIFTLIKRASKMDVPPPESLL